MTPLRTALAGDHTAPGRWSGRIPEGWGQGRATYGGVQSAILLQTMQSLVEPDRVPRTLTVHFVGPLGREPATATARIEGAGGSVSHASARLVEGETLKALATASFGRARDHAFTAPAAPMPALADPVAFAFPQGPGIPEFTRYVYMHLTEGMPYGGAEQPRFAGWVRFRDPEPPDAPLLAALADIWPPAPIATFREPRPSSSVDLTYHFLEPTPVAGVAEDAWYAFEATTAHARDGYAEERGRVWAPDGRALVSVRQLRAVY